MDTLGDSQQTFPPETSSVSAARRFVCAHLDHLDQPDVLWSAVQLVSELATNAVLHARSVFSVAVLVLADGAVRLEVTDNGDAIPRHRRYGGDATTGRGVALVAGLARDWGVEKLVGGGKIVWCEIVDSVGGLAAPHTEESVGAPAGDSRDGRDGARVDGASTTASADGQVIVRGAADLTARIAA